MDDCIFCKLASHEIPTNMVYEDDLTAAFCDMAPQMPTHVLVVPKKHIANLNETKDEDAALLGALLLTVQKVAKLTGIDRTGYRIISNCGKDACQSVQHLHIHVLGGGQMSEKMN